VYNTTNMLSADAIKAQPDPQKGRACSNRTNETLSQTREPGPKVKNVYQFGGVRIRSEAPTLGPLWVCFRRHTPNLESLFFWAPPPKPIHVGGGSAGFKKFRGEWKLGCGALRNGFRNAQTVRYGCPIMGGYLRITGRLEVKAMQDYHTFSSKGAG
jgi:hypothetical protein